MPAEVRPARPADAPRIAEIYNAGIAERSSTFETDPRSGSDILAWLEGGERLPVLVAAAGGFSAGRGSPPTATARPTPEWGRCRSTSIGRRAAGYRHGPAGRADRPGEELGYWKLTGKLFAENEASVRLVKRNGWREVGLHLRHARLDGEWRDVMVMERLLDQAPAPEGGASSPGA